MAARRDGDAVRAARRQRGARRRAERRERRPRHQAREAALQMLYQWEVGRADARRGARRRSSPSTQPDAPATRARRSPTTLVRGTVARRRRARRAHRSSTPQHWRLERMAVIDRLILRLAVCELLHAAGHAAGGRHQRGARAGADVQHRRCGEVRQRRARRRSARSSNGRAPATDATIDRPMSNEAEQIAQRQANLEELDAPRRRAVSRTTSIAPRRSSALVAAHGEQTGEALEAEPARDGARPAASSASAASARPTSSCCPTGSRGSRSTSAQDALPERDFQIFKLLDFGDHDRRRGPRCSGPRPTS